MVRQLVLMTVVASAIAALADVASAQQNPAAPAAKGTTAPAQEYRVKQILGTKVNIQGDVSIGTVHDIVFGDDGVVEYLVVLNEGKLVTVPWEAAKFNFEQKTANVNITMEQFRTIPTYTADQYPSFYAPEYRTQVYRYYGLTPRQMRRIERR